MNFKHIRFFCTPLSPGACSNSCSLRWWCYLTVASSAIPFSSSFSFSIRTSNDYSGLISFRIDWFGFLAVQRTLKSLLQHHSSKASILRHSVLCMVQLSNPYMIMGKTIALSVWIFVGKVMSLLFNILSRLVITFLPRSKYLLISWLQLLSTVILELK